jgi:hypothetical protein
MTTSPFALLDGMVAPIIIAANRVRQVRDSLPVQFWTILPAAFRRPVEALFLAVEEYDRMVGRLREAGLIEKKEGVE